MSVKKLSRKILLGIAALALAFTFFGVPTAPVHAECMTSGPTHNCGGG